MTIQTRLLGDAALSVGSPGFALDVRLPWYRALPLSTIDIGELRVDGHCIDPRDIGVEVNGKLFRLDELRDRSDEWWYVLDSAYLHVSALNVKPGSEHEIDFTLTLYPPYIPGLAWVTKSHKRLLVKERRA
jgi:hypothetical protein